ncbi:MAG: thymidylate kinase [Clostridia bacterium]|nr:thymidylate kinase [Clostridia bacterium]
MVCENLEKQGIPFRKIVFPRYTQQSSALIRMYLGGEFGTSPDAVNPYAASTFFAVDRYASFKTDWEQDYLAGVPIICDRYTTSNAVHQAAKLPEGEVDGFLNWLFDYEYRLLGIPAPTKVFFLDMPAELTFDLLKKRQGDSGDIHELDHEYLMRCRKNANSVCDKLDWHRISCAQNGRLRTPEEINADIMKIILE